MTNPLTSDEKTLVELYRNGNSAIHEAFDWAARLNDRMNDRTDVFAKLLQFMNVAKYPDEWKELQDWIHFGLNDLYKEWSVSASERDADGYRIVAEFVYDSSTGWILKKLGLEVR